MYHNHDPDNKIRRWDHLYGCYAGGEHLLQAIQDGWEITQVRRERYYLGSNRSNLLYHFVLKKDLETLHMPVISNPIVERIISAFYSHTEIGADVSIELFAKITTRS